MSFEYFNAISFEATDTDRKITLGLLIAFFVPFISLFI